MNLAMANGFGGVGFTEMNELEMMWVDGGIDWAGVGSGLFDMVGGVVEGVIGGACYYQRAFIYYESRWSVCDV